MAENNTNEETAVFLQLVHQTHRNAKLQGNSNQMPPRIQSSSLPASSSSTVAKWHLSKKRFHHLLLFTKNQLKNVLRQLLMDSQTFVDFAFAKFGN